jgi:hypothetical protein
MKQTRFYTVVGFLALAVLVAPVTAGPAGQARRGITGDWLIKADFEGRQMTSILTLSRDKEGNLTGQWVSFFGLSELKDIKYEDNKLSFVQVSRFGDNEFKSDFAGTVEGGTLTGTMSSERGELKMEGTRIRTMPAVVGSWEMKVKMGERELTGTLVVKADQERNLTAEWQSERGEHQISDIQYERGKLTFKRTSKFQDRQFESTFEGAVKEDTLSGTFKSERGEAAAEGKRIGAALIGKWELEMTSDRGTFKQMLQVNPDLSGMYGPMAVKKVNLQGNQVTFQIVLEFGDRKFEINFKGELDGKKLTGEVTSSMGTQTVTGKKLPPPVRRGGSGRAS